MFKKIKSFLNSEFYNRYKYSLARLVYIFFCLIIFFLCCSFIDNESLESFFTLPIGVKCGIIFLIYIFLSPPTTNDLYQDEQFNVKFDLLLSRIERLESCASPEEGADIGENE